MGFRQITAYLRRRWRNSNAKTNGEVDIGKIEPALSISPSSDLSSSSVCAEVIETEAPKPLLYQLRSKEEEKFNCQFRIPACDVKYSMVTTVTKSWDQDLKTIPNWDRIGGEILLRKYVHGSEQRGNIHVPPSYSLPIPLYSQNVRTGTRLHSHV
jgi:hypothetical protein